MRTIDRTSSSELVAAIVGELRGTLRQLRCETLERILNLDVSMTQMHVLWLLEHHGAVPMSRLAELLEVSVSNSTGLIDRMEERGLVERVRDRDDRRLVLVRVGSEGGRVLRNLEAAHHERLRQALASLEPGRLCGVLEAITDLRSAIESDLGSATHSHGSDPDVPGTAEAGSVTAAAEPVVPAAEPVTGS